MELPTRACSFLPAAWLLALSACGPTPPRAGEVVERIYTPAGTSCSYENDVCIAYNEQGGYCEGWTQREVCSPYSESYKLRVRDCSGDTCRTYTVPVTKAEYDQATVGNYWAQDAGVRDGGATRTDAALDGRG